MKIENFFFNAEIEGKEVAPGVFRKVLAYHNNLMVCELEFQKGAIGTLHQHPHEQITYIISGKFEFEVNGVKKILVAGDSTFKEPNVIHGAVCLEQGKLIDIFTPMREDFI